MSVFVPIPRCFDYCSFVVLLLTVVKKVKQWTWAVFKLPWDPGHCFFYHITLHLGPGFERVTNRFTHSGMFKEKSLSSNLPLTVVWPGTSQSSSPSFFIYKMSDLKGMSSEVSALKLYDVWKFYSRQSGNDGDEVAFTERSFCAKIFKSIISRKKVSSFYSGYYNYMRRWVSKNDARLLGWRIGHLSTAQMWWFFPKLSFYCDFKPRDPSAHRTSGQHNTGVGGGKRGAQVVPQPTVYCKFRCYWSKITWGVCIQNSLLF